MTARNLDAERLELALEATGLDLWENDLISGEIPCKPGRTLAELGYSAEDAPHNIDDIYSLVHPDDTDRLRQAVQSHLDGLSECYRCEFRLRARSGHWIWYANYGRIVDRTADQPGRRFIGFTFNIHERKCREDDLDRANRKLVEQNLQLEHMNARLNALATSDPLTRLPNRRLLLNRLHDEIHQSSQDEHTRALLFIDLDNFKTLNDTLGHGNGDMLLRQVAERLRDCVRETDTVARIGGDEFVIILGNLGDDARSQSEIIGHKIIAELNRPYQLATHEYLVTPSIGITLFDSNTHSSGELLHQTDIAMYQAKRDGRNTLRFFEPHMQHQLHARAGLEADLNLALGQDQFRLHYQFQYDHNRQAVGAEALIRWQHPQLGELLPRQFIPLAEESGLILPIGRWVLEHACRQLAQWGANPALRHLFIAVNVSPRQFRQPDFVAMVSEVAATSGIRPDRLRIELTEHLLLDDIEQTIATMKALGDIGIRFSLDNFGTGCSSLQHLCRLPLHQLKIDQSFVRNLGRCDNNLSVVRTIMAMAGQLELDVVAEGVETDEQKRLLDASGLLHYQGFLFGRPLPAEQLGRPPLSACT